MIESLQVVKPGLRVHLFCTFEYFVSSGRIYWWFPIEDKFYSPITIVTKLPWSLYPTTSGYLFIWEACFVPGFHCEWQMVISYREVCKSPMKLSIPQITLYQMAISPGSFHQRSLKINISSFLSSNGNLSKSLEEKYDKVISHQMVISLENSIRRVCRRLLQVFYLLHAM